jgi:hypothetical protein
LANCAKARDRAAGPIVLLIATRRVCLNTAALATLAEYGQDQRGQGVKGVQHFVLTFPDARLGKLRP